MNILKKITLPLIALGMTAGITGNAYGVVSNVFEESGRQWGDPFVDLISKNEADQLAELPTGAVYATWLDILDAADIGDTGEGVGVTTNAEYEAFLDEFGFFDGAPNCTLFSTVCFARATAATYGAVGGDTNGDSYGFSTPAYYYPYLVGDVTPYPNVGLMWYQTQTPAPSTLGLLGASLMGMGYVAYRRRKA